MTTFFGSTDQIEIGAVVFDRMNEMPGTVRNVLGLEIEIERPSGHIWHVNWRRLRPATEREIKQLSALHRLHLKKQRGLPRS